MKSDLWLVTLFPILFFACGSPPAVVSIANVELKIEIADSIRIPYIGKLNLMDVSPENELMLFFDIQNMKFVSTDFEGKVIGEFTKERDAPDGFGFYPMAAGKFNSSKNIQVVSSSGIFEYDLKGNLMKSVKVPRDQILPFSGRADAKRELLVVKDKILLAGLIARGEFNKTQPEFYDTYLQLVWADPKTGKYERFLNLDPESVFQNERSHEPSTLSTSFEVVDNELYVISGTDPYLNTYGLDAPYPRINRIPLNLTNYQLNPGEDPKKADPRAIGYDPSFGIIQKVIKVRNHLFLTYETGYDAEDASQYQENMSADEWKEFNTRILEKYSTRYQILNLEGNRLMDAELPNQLSDLYVSRDDAIWFLGKQNPDKEEDFYTVYKVSIN